MLSMLDPLTWTTIERIVRVIVEIVGLIAAYVNVVEVVSNRVCSIS